MMLPIALDVRGRAVLIVGGGAVAARKAGAFADGDAIVTVVSPERGDGFPPIHHRAKLYESSDLDGFSLVCACTNSPEVNAQIARDAKARGVWCNIADAPEKSDFHTTAVVRRGDVAIGISTGGLSPVLSRHLKAEIESCIGAEYAELLDLVEGLSVSTSQRGEFWRAVLASDALEKLRSHEHKSAAETLETVFKSLAPPK